MAKIIEEINNKDTGCNSLLVTKYQDDEGITGVLLIAWHQWDGDDLMQTDFIKIPENLIDCFISDFSKESANEYINSFEV